MPLQRSLVLLKPDALHRGIVQRLSIYDWQPVFLFKKLTAGKIIHLVPAACIVSRTKGSSLEPIFFLLPARPCESGCSRYAEMTGRGVEWSVVLARDPWL